MNKIKNLPKKITIHPQGFPKHKVGDTIYVIRGRRYISAEIIRIRLDITWHIKEYYSFWTGYVLDKCVGDRAGDNILKNEIDKWDVYFDTEEEAKSEITWIPVTGITSEEWLKALGERETFGNLGNVKVDLEEAELSICCSDISEARDILYDCQKEGGVIKLNSDRLKLLMGSHNHIIFVKENKVLRKILKQIWGKLPEKED